MLKENKKKFELVILKWAYVPAVLIPKNARVFTHVPDISQNLGLPVLNEIVRIIVITSIGDQIICYLQLS